ncbi:response regulator [Lachnospiraceae bacterium 54-53]
MYKVCFVDDEAINYQLFEKMVPWEEKGFQIAGTAADGLGALQMYERLQPDLIFMDIQLPLMDGLECVRCIREENKDVQIVIVSAYSDFSYAQKAIRYGVQDFLLKPVSRMILNQQVDKIRKVLDARLQPGKRFDLYSNPCTEELAQVLSCISRTEDSQPLPLRLLPQLKVICRLILRPLSGEEISAAQLKELTAGLQTLPSVSHGLVMIFTPSGTSLYLGYDNAGAAESASGSLMEFFENKRYAPELYLWKNDEKAIPLADFLERSASMENYGFYETGGRVYQIEAYPFEEKELDTAPLDGLIVTALAENTPEKLLDFIWEQFDKARAERVSPHLLKNFVLDVLLKIKFCLKKFSPETTKTLNLSTYCCTGGTYWRSIVILGFSSSNPAIKSPRISSVYQDKRLTVTFSPES